MEKIKGFFFCYPRRCPRYAHRALGEERSCYHDFPQCWRAPLTMLVKGKIGD